MIKVHNLVKDYGTFRAVDHLTFEVRKGEIVGLLGPNGSGKTTTLRMLAGLMDPTSGTIEIAGLPLRENAIGAKRLLGFQSGDTQLYARLTPREILAFCADLYEVPARTRDARIDFLLTGLEAQAFADRRMASLSSGQKQRIALARTLVHDPSILILDEITASLDLLSARFVTDYLAQSRREGKTILFSTHILSEAEHLCDRILLLHEGRFLAGGTCGELLQATGTKNLTECFFACLDRRARP